MIPRDRRASLRSGFTVIEVIVAVALLLLLLGAVMSLMWSAQDQRSRVSTLSGATRDVLALFDQIESDLMTAVTADPREGSGITGDARSIRILFRSVWLRGSLDDRTPRDLQGASYVFDADTRRVEGERWAVSGAHSRATLCDRLSDVRIRYSDGSSWVDEFDAASSAKMPMAVEIRVTTLGGQTWQRIVRIPDSQEGGA